MEDVNRAIGVIGEPYQSKRNVACNICQNRAIGAIFIDHTYMPKKRSNGVDRVIRSHRRSNGCI